MVHGDEGIAGPWARDAAPGDASAFSGPSGAYSPDPTADWHLFAGDESAQPAITAALQALPENAVGVALLEVYGVDDEVDLGAPAGVQISWLAPWRRRRRTRPRSWRRRRRAALARRAGARLRSRRAGVDEGATRHPLQAEGLERTQVSLSGYWAYGRTEDKFQAEKREPIGQI